MAFLHIAGGGLDVLQGLLNCGQIGVRLVGAAHIGLTDDFDQRCAATVQIYIGITVGILEAVVNALAGIVFHVDTRDADALALAFDRDFDPAALGQRLVVLGNLIALG